jgi:hypothetical protein
LIEVLLEEGEYLLTDGVFNVLAGEEQDGVFVIFVMKG